MRKLWILIGAVICLALVFILARSVNHRRVVVVYTALDRVFSEPIFTRFEKKTGIAVLAKYDTEATKTVGLVNAIRAEKNRPRCDVFWNNEIVNTIRLKNEGLLQKFVPKAAGDYPAEFKDADGYWHGFAGRARVLVVNTDLVKEDEMPTSIYDLARPGWQGKAGIAKPLFGTTATHAACLFACLGEKKAEEFFLSLKENDIVIEQGNKTCAEHTSAGILAFALTDTDDAVIEVEAGKPVTIVYPDASADALGVLFIPNTLSLVKGAPHPEEAKALIEYLLSPEVEIALAMSPSAQIPLNTKVKFKARVKTPKDVKVVEVDFEEAAAQFEKASKFIEKHFLE